MANRKNDLDSAGTNPLFNFFQEMPVALLKHDAMANMVESLARAMGVEEVTTDFTDTLFELTGGHPALARSISGEAYRRRKTSYRLSAADLAVGLSHLEDTNSIGFFLRNNLWEQMTTTERDVVAQLARRPIKSQLGPRRRGRDVYQEAYATLQSQGIVENDRVRIGLFNKWLLDQNADV
jgi:hypothetical protein